MKLWICNNHPTHYPVGGASIVVAPDETIARTLLTTELSNHGLIVERPEDLKLIEVTTERAAAYVINDGNY